MNKLKCSQLIVFFALTFLFANTASSSTVMGCYQHDEIHFAVMPDYDSSGFNVVNSSCRTLVSKHWNSFGMEWKHWKSWGFDNACNVNTPLNRTFRALELLRISKNTKLSKQNILNSAYDLSKSWIHHLRADCAANKMDSASGRHIPKPNWEDEVRKGNDPGSGTVYLYQNIFGNSIVTIANTIVHEARHKQKPHDGGNGCERRASCDSSFQYKGANAVQFAYSWWYGMHSTHSNKFTRQRALDEARYLQNSAFNKPPEFYIPKNAH